MSYAICRMQKMKSYDLKGMQFHNQRERESKTNPDIDENRTSLNYDLANPEPIDYNQKVKEIIESQKTTPRKVRKDAVLVNELLITSDREFFDGLDDDEQDKFFEESYKLFAKRYGEQNIAYAMVHNDEKTPHLHMGVVPMLEGKLQGKNVFNRSELQWIQDEFPKHMKAKGFEVERGEKGSDREHLTTQKLKADTLEEKIEKLQDQYNEYTKDMNQLHNHRSEVQQQLIELNEELAAVDESRKKVDMIPVTEKGLFGRKSIQMEREDYEHLKGMAKASETLKKENKSLQEQNQKIRQQRDQAKERRNELAEENYELKIENKFLKRTMKKVKEVVQNKFPQIGQYFGFAKAYTADRLLSRKSYKFEAEDQNESAGVKEYNKHRELIKQGEKEHEHELER